MLLATILLLYPFPQSGEATKAVTERPAGVSMDAAKDSSLSKALPSGARSQDKDGRGDCG